jgi:signal transduction histidine kinase
MLSHEIRTPLGSIRGYADLLAREVADLETAGTPLPPTVREFVDSIDDRAGRLVNLVRDLLELSAIEMGHVSVENVPVRLRAVLGEVIPTITEELERKRLTLAVDVPGDPVVLSDARRLELVLGRLLSNALKFTAEGSITVRAREEDGTLAIEIQDTGIGISEAFRRRMFAPFNQEDDWLNRGHGGIGLGLTLVQRAVELLGGRLEVDSRKEAGSTFRVVLPAATLALD